MSKKSDAYEWSTVRGTQCIIWKCKQNTTKGKKNLLKKEKDQLGRENPNVPIVDTRYSGSRKEICDIIVYSRNLDKWEKAIEQYYGNRVMCTEIINSGYQRTITQEKGGDVFVVISFYKTNKFMVQPGDQEESHLLSFLKEFSSLLSLIPCNPDIQSKPTPIKNNDNANGNAAFLPGSSLTVSLPPLDMIYNSTSTTLPTADTPNNNLPDSKDHSTSANGTTKSCEDQIVVNELLCFLQNRLDRLPAEIVINICNSFYDDDDVFSAKQQLFNITQNVRDSKHRFIKRCGERKRYENLQDMVNVLLSIQMKSIPTFAAKNLSKLPPLSAMDSDVTGLCNDIISLKQEISQLAGYRKDLNDAVVEVRRLTQNPPIQAERPQHSCPSQERAKTRMHEENMRLTQQQSTTAHVVRPRPDSIRSHDSASTTESLLAPPHVISLPEKNTENALHEPEAQTRHKVNAWLQSIPPSIHTSSTQPSCLSDFQTIDCISQHTEQTKQRSHTWSKVDYNRRKSKSPPKQNNQYNESRNWERSNKSITILGNGQREMGVRAIAKTNTNTFCTGILVSRLQPKTSAAQLAVHVYRETGIRVRPEKLQVHHREYCSFYIRCNQTTRQQLLHNNIWPLHSLVKPFYN